MPADHSWLALIEIERQKRAILSKPEFQANPDTQALREWWEVVGQIFRRLGPLSGEVPRPLPIDLFRTISGLARYLAVGQVPEPISKVVGKGRTAPGPTEESHIRLAVTYRQAVADGLISDPRPNKTIAEAFGIRSSRTIQEWCQRHEAFPGYERFPESIEKRMREAGEIYSRRNRRTWSAPKKKTMRDRADK